MKNVILLITILLCANIKLLAQEHYFYPMVGGMINATDGKTYYTIELPGKDSVQIYNAIKKQIVKNFEDATKVFVGDEPNKYLKIYGMQAKSIGSGEFAFDLTYNIDIDIKSGKYRFYFTNVKIDRKDSNGQIVSLVLKNGNNLFADTEKYLFHNNKPAIVFSTQYIDLIKWTDRLSKIVDIRNSINAKTDSW